MADKTCAACGEPLSARQRKFCSQDCQRKGQAPSRKKAAVLAPLERIETLAAQGCSLEVIAAEAGMDRRAFLRRRQEDEELEAAFRRGRAANEQELVGLLMRRARKDDATATTPILFALKSIHGWLEGQANDGGSNVNVGVQVVLPSPMTMEEYQKTITAEVVSDE